MAVVGLVDGVFIMIRKTEVGSACFCSEFGGISVYFSLAAVGDGGNVALYSSCGLVVAHIFNRQPDYADRVAELKALGLIE